MATEKSQIVWAATYSTEQPFLKNFPSAFQYVLGLRHTFWASPVIGHTEHDVHS